MGCRPDLKVSAVLEHRAYHGRTEHMNTTETAKRSLQVLHLEDDLIDAQLIREELEGHQIPCTVTLISSPNEFAATLREREIDLVLSDSSVPGFDTLLALKIVREQRPQVPFVFISDNSSPKLRSEAFRLGATDFISKRELVKLPHILATLFFANGAIPVGSTPPEIGVPVIVQCEEYRCLGFFGADGKWRDFCTSVELPRVLSWSDV
jgi:CheY-like chemotaxis protein